MESFVPRLHLNNSRTFTGNGRLEGISRLNETAVPYNASRVSGAGYNINTSSSNNNNTSMTSNTMSSDVQNEGGYRGFGASGAPPSPVPRFNENWASARHDGFRATSGFAASALSGWPGQSQRSYADPLGERNAHTTSRTTTSGSRPTPGLSTMRPLFTSQSASSPRDTNVLAGDTGHAPLWGAASPSSSSSAAAIGAAGEPREDFLNRYRRFYDAADGPFTTASAPRDGTHSLFGSSHPNPNTFTSTYIGTSTGAMPFNKPAYAGVNGGCGVADFDWRGDTHSLTTGARSAWQRQQYRSGEGTNGLVDSRSRARVDRWTDEAVDAFDDNATTLDDIAPPSQTTSSSASYENRRSRRRRRGRRGSRGRGNRGDTEDGSSGSRSDSHADGDEDSDDLWDGDDDADSLSFADAVVRAMDAQPVVPLEMLRKAQATPFIWIRHPSHGIVLSLLQHRGIYLPRYRELVDYHMAELFLHYLDLCREGAYFVYYAPSKWPKERFFRIRMLPVNRLEASTEPVPHLVMTLHESGVHILDAIPLDNLVGVTVSPQAACFRPFLESPNTIIGCREGRGHRARMPIDGAFSLWFYDVRQHTSRSVDLLTCDAKVFDIWTKTFRGLVSVNSSSVVQVAMTPQGDSAELAGLTQAAREQSEIDCGESKGKYDEN